MDADYYFVTAKVLASGGGLSEPFIWNYLDNPMQIPHSAFQYWMPMTSFLAAFSQMIFGVGFRTAQLPFVLLAAILPVFTAWIAYKLHEDAQLAWQSGLLALVPGLFLPFLVTTDSFSIYGILGPLAFITIVHAVRKGDFLRWFIPGIFAGLAHLTRADGILFLLMGIFVAIVTSQPRQRAITGIISGYLIIMLPWWIVNWSMSGGFIASGSAHLLWSTTYNEIFAFPPEKLTFQHWLQSGLGNILLVRVQALWDNLGNLFLVNGVIFLSPFMIIGGWNQRKNLIVRLVFFYLILLLVLMSFVFPFAGSRGGFFHSSMAFMPILWALAPLGLRIAIDKGVELRNWQREQAAGIFINATFVLAVIVTLALFWIRVVGPDYLNSTWSASKRAYTEAAQWFENEGVVKSIIAVNNPPGFYAESGLQAVVIPDGNEEVLRQVVEQFGVDWVLLDSNHPADLNTLYENPNSSIWLDLLDTLEDLQSENLFIFKVKADQP